jgi:hypothetical protein
MFWSSWKICHFDVIHTKTYTIYYIESSVVSMGLGCGKFLTNLKYYLGSNCTKHFLCDWIVQNVFVKCIILLIMTLALGLEHRLKHDKRTHWENVLRFKGCGKMQRRESQHCQMDFGFPFWDLKKQRQSHQPPLIWFIFGLYPDLV